MMFSARFVAGSQEAYTEQVDLQTDKNKRKIAQLQKENKEKRQKLKELLEVSSSLPIRLPDDPPIMCQSFRAMKKC